MPVIDSDSDLDAEGEDDVDALMELAADRGDTPVIHGQGVSIDPLLWNGRNSQQYQAQTYPPPGATGNNGGGGLDGVYSDASRAFTSSQSNSYSSYASPYNPSSHSHNGFPPPAIPTYQPPIDHDDYYANLRGASPSPPAATPARPQRNRQRTSSSIDSASRVGPSTAQRTVEGKKRSGESSRNLTTPGTSNWQKRAKVKVGGPKRDEECSFCFGTDLANREGNPEQMLSCDLCGTSGHPSCLSMTSPKLLSKVRTYSWQCIECKICEICRVKGIDGRLMFCDGCDRGWHCYCLDPPFAKPPKGIWKCPICTESESAAAYKRDQRLSSQTPNIFGETSDSASALNGNDKSARKKKSRTAETPATNGFSRKMKQKESFLPELDFSPSPSEAVKRRSKQMETGDATPTQVRSSTVIKIRLPLHGGGGLKGVKKRKRGDSPVEPEEPADPPEPFGGVITGEDADTRATEVKEADKLAFEKSRTAAEVKLGAVLLSSSGDIVGPSTPSVSEYGRAGGSSPHSPSLSPAPPPSNPFRPLRDRLLLQQTNLPHNPPFGADQFMAGSSMRPTVSSSQYASPGALPVASRIQAIRFGNYDIDTWYSAPYPEEYSKVPDGRLWLCEFCLKYMKSGFVAGRHAMKCKTRHPPGDEIYRDGPISVFEVDGRKNKIYCQNLCLLAKMYLDHKTLYYDVEPFLFYVMTEVDDGGARFVGYFSKEKRSEKFNVSCIMTLPIRQRKGWGNLLIDFSYLLSKKEGRLGSPEKPLSALGALSYRNYWTSTLMKHLDNAQPGIKLDDIAKATSMTLEDIFATLSEQQMIQVHDPPPVVPASNSRRRPFPVTSQNSAVSLSGIQPDSAEGVGIARQALSRSTVPKDPEPTSLPISYTIVWDPEAVRAYVERVRSKGYLELRPEKLKYTPFLVTRIKLGDVGFTLAEVVGTEENEGTRKDQEEEEHDDGEKGNVKENEKEVDGDATMVEEEIPEQQMETQVTDTPAEATTSIALPPGEPDGEASEADNEGVNASTITSEAIDVDTPPRRPEPVRYLTPPPRSMRSSTRTPVKTAVSGGGSSKATPPTGNQSRTISGRFARKR